MDEKQIQLKNARENEIYALARDFFKECFMNLCSPMGDTGRFDIAFQVDRRPIVLKAMQDFINQQKDEI